MALYETIFARRSVRRATNVFCYNNGCNMDTLYYMSIKISFVLLLAYMAAYFFKPTQGNTTRNGRSIR
jgi:hypothetical protein